MITMATIQIPGVGGLSLNEERGTLSASLLESESVSSEAVELTSMTGAWVGFVLAA